MGKMQMCIRLNFRMRYEKSRVLSDFSHSTFLISNT